MNESNGPATGLLTDTYELTMLDAALADGVATKRATFEVFARRTPDGGRFGLVGGMDRAVEAILNFRFDVDDIEFLAELGIVSDRTLDYLATYRFAGDVTGRLDGDLWVPNAPVLTVDDTFAGGLVLETVLLSILNRGCALASAAGRIRLAAGGARLIEMGSRRTDPEAAVEAGRIAWMAGFDGTSNLAAGKRYGVPVLGTTAHAWTLAHTSEAEAFESQIRSLGVGTTLLVDTYDTATGIRNAVAAAKAAGFRGPRAIRIDSGELDFEARRARVLLDSLGASSTEIVVSGDLDERQIGRLRRDGAPIDAYGVGTRYVAVAPVGMVYKLVAIETPAGMTPVSKRTTGKADQAGRKTAWRRFDADGRLVGETVTVGEAPGPEGAIPVGEPLLIAGERTSAISADPRSATREGRERFAQSLALTGAAADLVTA